MSLILIICIQHINDIRLAANLGAVNRRLYNHILRIYSDNQQSLFASYGILFTDHYVRVNNRAIIVAKYTTSNRHYIEYFIVDLLDFRQFWIPEYMISWILRRSV